MIIEFKCPHCKKSLEADVAAETRLKCPVCGGSIFISQQFIDDAVADSLMDPADPAGMLNYFPEDE
jgi:DNA-directed RNA polymerase subunit RPC12/RpoP